MTTNPNAESAAKQAADEVTDEVIRAFDEKTQRFEDMQRQLMAMGKSISVGELRQNPTRMLREVKAGAVYTITDHGEPIAEVAARRQPRWIPSEEIDSLLRELGSDDAWAREIAADRAAVDIADPWEGGT